MPQTERTCVLVTIVSGDHICQYTLEMHSLIMVLVGLAHGGLIFVETLDIGLTRSMDPVIAALHESSRPGAGGMLTNFFRSSLPMRLVTFLVCAEIGVQAPVQNYELTGTQSAGIDPEVPLRALMLRSEFTSSACAVERAEDSCK